MGLLAWFKARLTRRDPGFDALRDRVAKSDERVKAYLCGRGLSDELEPDELLFAVIIPLRTQDQSRSFRELGELLVAWKAGREGVRRVLGLERLLDGKAPEVAVTLLGIWCDPTMPETLVEPVALVVIDASAEQDSLASSLCGMIKRSGVAQAWSCEQYSDWNR